MSVLKMEAVTIAGKISDFDKLVSKYVVGREIHLENAVSVLENGEKLVPFEEDARFDNLFNAAKNILSAANIEPDGSGGKISLSYEEMSGFLDNAEKQIADISSEKELNLSRISENEKIIHQFDNLVNVDVDLTKLLHFRFIDYHFGRMPKSSYKTLKTFLGDIEAIFLKTSEEKEDIWGFYFAPKSHAEKINAVFDSLYFDELVIPDAAIGTPQETCKYLQKQNETLKEDISRVDEEIKAAAVKNLDTLLGIYEYAKEHMKYEALKRKAAHSNDFFYIVGWMPVKEAKKLDKEAHSDESLIFFMDDARNMMKNVKPPTKLKNPKLIRPFEMFVNMYGLPSYGEIDPTIFFAITYFLLYGIMFGDVGQSAIFAIAGYFLYRKTKNKLAAIISAVGVSGIGFGFIYGSVFGNEEILSSVRLIEPLDQIMFMLIGAVTLGIGLILICMVLNMINSVKEKDIGKLLFSPNGVSGLVFYVSMLLLVLNMVLKLGISSKLLGILMAVTFVLMFLEIPLTELVSGAENKTKKDGMFFVESFFEMFDVLLSFVTNTISFLRVGAFAIIHVGMMLAVTMLAGSGIGGIIVKIFGNALVMGLEGLIVGIQVLRLEYYEMFSRYFKGDGKPFIAAK